MRRRDLIIATCAVAAVIALPRLAALRDPGFSFQPIPGLEGFRRIDGGGFSRTSDVFAGLVPAAPQQQDLRDWAARNPCIAAFGPEGWTEDKLPVAVFTDYNCPFCPRLSDMVISLADAGLPIRPVWHDLPVLGQRSEAAARVAVAAARQGQYLPVHAYLMRTVLRPGPEPVAALAARFGMDAARLLRDAQGESVERQLAETKAIAAVLGIVGTPAVLVGRTLAIGEIDRSDLERLIDLERSTPFAGCHPA
ncbi:DsbA family protein [Sedimentitalea sp. JM2-8]|uniref:DsbA family protein n=1 Tax=Sedimentitalea xiamensis TaxID=3050037 RepID=A0ABT7F954_9RHOB|nr:DsbA family protein [Sedimentitalea xiamensis]MDK3071638.1 DsbA family protein [Sedimentitalea xiamensis]